MIESMKNSGQLLANVNKAAIAALTTSTGIMIVCM